MGMHPFYKSQTKYTTRKVILKILIQTIEIKKAPWLVVPWGFHINSNHLFWILKSDSIFNTFIIQSNIL